MLAKPGHTLRGLPVGDHAARGVSSIFRRRFLVRAGVSCVALWAAPAYGGSYLDRASILLSSALDELSYLASRLYDTELAQVLHRVAASRLGAAGEMMVPKEVVLAHPHLLMMLESCERATSAAVEKQAKDFLKFARSARDEDQLFRSVLKQLGWVVPTPR